MSNSTALVPIEALDRMADAFAKSNMFGAKNKEQALSLLLLAQAEGVHPAIAMRDFHVIQGRPAKKAEAMHRAFLEAGGRIEWHQLDDTKADATFSHPQGGTVRIAWDMERMKTAGIQNKEMYSKYPRQMLKARTISEGCRTVYPASTSGLYVPEEVQHFGPNNAKDMGNAQIVEPAANEEVLISPDQAVELEDVFKARAEENAKMKPPRTQAKLLSNVTKSYGKSITLLGQIRAEDYADAMKYASGQ